MQCAVWGSVPRKCAAVEKRLGSTDPEHLIFEIRMESKIRRHRYKLYKRQTGTQRNSFFSFSRVVNPWIELDEKTVALDMVEKFRRKLSEFG